MPLAYNLFLLGKLAHANACIKGIETEDANILKQLIKYEEEKQTNIGEDKIQIAIRKAKELICNGNLDEAIKILMEVEDKDR